MSYQRGCVSCGDHESKKFEKSENKSFEHKSFEHKSFDCKCHEVKKHCGCEEKPRCQRCPSPKILKKECRSCPKPREDCEEIKTVRVGIFRNSQPNADILEISGCERAVGFDVELAWEIYHNRLGYCVEFYEVNTQNVGLNVLTCGLVDVVASSTANITEPRLLLANYIETEAAPELGVGVIYPSNLGITCGPDALRQLWLAIGGPAGMNGCPTQANFRVARNSLGTVQSNILRDALSAAYPNCPELPPPQVSVLDAFFLQQTVEVRQFSCAEIVAGFGTLFEAAVIGPRGDVTQLQVIFDELPAGQYTLCPVVATVAASARGWAIRNCALAIETQNALNAVINDGTYENFVAQAANFPLFVQDCLLAGAGETFLIPPARNNLSITSGFIDAACLACLCNSCTREVKCPCEKPLVRPHALTGSILCAVPFDCCACECDQNNCRGC